MDYQYKDSKKGAVDNDSRMYVCPEYSHKTGIKLVISKHKKRTRCLCLGSQGILSDLVPRFLTLPVVFPITYFCFLLREMLVDSSQDYYIQFQWMNIAYHVALESRGGTGSSILLVSYLTEAICFWMSHDD